MKYGKLVDGHLVPAPNPLLGPIFKHYNPTEDIYRKFGYLPVVETAPPEEGFYEPSWAEQEGRIVQVWTEAEPPVPEPDAPTWQEAINSRISSLENAVDGLIIAQLEVSGDV